MTLSTTTVDALRDLQQVAWQNSEDKGFHDNEPTGAAELAIYNGNRLMLIVSEAAEALEEIRAGRSASETYYPDAPKDSHAERPEPGRYKPEGVPSELADIVIRCFDFAGSNGFDLGQIIQEKLTYNRSRERMHGKRF
ncbi:MULTISPECIES: hypothetical protein [Arthrobacter]|uniref:MazG-like nucleotide pyrophosphohydrolase n=1 Tax=Arthrobacter terricola TaxID=2547396 RepID=A0A4R5K8C7_9MICC|nr:MULTISPECIES: hypothetical protein [Arthrobacter]MBT8163059.1 hypothetical protein [Arthrobacter sp. GN70]TDF88099.1 hypothetical protein E1809_24070 [Arthrobacter terricola]